MNGGLDIAAAQLFDATVAWHVEYDTAPSKILAHHWPDVPNYGDVTTCDWESMPPVDIITGGTPCQDLSAAGRRLGMTEGTRSNLWVHMREAIAIIRPGYVIWENVLGALSATAASASDMESRPRSMGDRSTVNLRALGRVLGDLASLGYDARWTTLRASDVGAPHHRARVFVVAEPADAQGVRRDYGQAEDEWATDREVNASGDDHDIAAECGSAMPADTDGIRWRQGPQQPSSGAQEVPATVGNLGALPGDGRTDDVLAVLPTPAACNPNDGEGPETWLKRREEVKARVKNGNGMGMPLGIAVQMLPTPTASDSTGGGQHPDKRVGHTTQLIDHALESGTPAWGKYAPAIRRWEQITRPAPAPTELNRNNKPRLASAFSEWMMGLPPGHVTNPTIGLSRSEQLKAIGNGVSPQQCYAAVRILLEMENPK